ncbi:Hypothetical protein PHPALM_11447 [Phytophthora palmivora]|uniref:Ubiquitin-like protease family profile domain-containing protein n=1 Tax=Phytophthora palmivora TaxID=4796 RepID=A0A2P4Y295_9STRA|nr:Hypothetical protein PHPALM_11447 [Phytophthora palmivora]
MAEMERELQAGVASLQAVQYTMRTASDSFMHGGLTQPTMRKATQGATLKTTQEATHAKVGYENEQSSSKTTRPQLQSKRRVIYVKIRRREPANVVVMSAEEKYCYAKAVFEPVMEHLSELTSPAFCSALQKWKEIDRKGLRGSVVSYSHMSDATTSPDESNEGDGGDEWNGSDADSDIGPTELIDTMNVMRKIGQNTLAMAEKARRLNPTITSRNGEATQNPRARSSPEDKMRCSCGNYRSGSATSTTVHTHASGTTKSQLLPNNASPKTGELSIKPAVQLAAKQDPKSSTHTEIERKKLKQAKLIAHEKHKKIAVINLPEKNVPALSRVLGWASNMYHVSGILEIYPVIMEDDFMSSHVAHSRCEYNFVIAKKLVIKLKAVVEAEKLKCKNRTNFNHRQRDEHPEGYTEEVMAFFPGGSPHFTSGAVYRMAQYHSVTKKYNAWMDDLNWLESINWSDICAHPELFDEETDCAGLMPALVSANHQQLARDIVIVLSKVCMSSTFGLPSGEGMVTVGNLVGMVARDRMLSDVILNFGIRCICDSIGSCYALDTVAPKIGCPTLPQTPVSTYNYLVLPGVIIVDLAYQTGAPTVTPYYYEHMCSTACNSSMESIYKSTVTGFLKSWHDVSMPGEPYPVVRNGRWIDGPKQPDGTSCGVLAIVHVYSMLKDNMHFTRIIVTDDEVTIMRLRIMWMIISHPWENTSRNKVAKAVTDTDVELLATIMT